MNPGAKTHGIEEDSLRYPWFKYMNAFWWVVRKIYSLGETLTKNFEVNSTNVTESNERTNIQTDKREGKNYIPLGISAGGIMILTSTIPLLL